MEVDPQKVEATLKDIVARMGNLEVASLDQLIGLMSMRAYLANLATFMGGQGTKAAPAALGLYEPSRN